MGGNDVFEYFTFPLGPYYALLDENRRYRYTEVGAPDWADINGICFMFNSATQQSDIYVDDLHISGKIIREASDTSELAAHDEYQRVILNDTAIDDTLDASDDSGLGGQTYLCGVVEAGADTHRRSHYNSDGTHITTRADRAYQGLSAK